MKQLQRIKKMLVFASLMLPLLALAGCGSNESSATAPGQPAGLTAGATTGQATLNWSAVSGATSYNIYYGTASGVTKVTASNSVSGVTGTTDTISGLLNGTTYYFIVTALNGNGESIASTEVSATPLAKPQGITVTAGDGQVIVAWSAAAGATSYKIYYGTAAGVTIGTGTVFANGVTPQTITGLTNGTTYYFVVTAVNSSGESGISSEKSATPAVAPQPPPNPTGVAVTSTVAGQATVSWSLVVGATGYNVYYLQTATAPTTATVISTGVKQASAASPATLLSLTSGAKYYVVVTSVNAAGESGGQTTPKSVTAL